MDKASHTSDAPWVLRSLVGWLGTDLQFCFSTVIPSALLLLGCSFSCPPGFPRLHALIVLSCLLEGGLYRPRVSLLHPSLLFSAMESLVTWWSLRLHSSIISIGNPREAPGFAFKSPWREDYSPAGTHGLRLWVSQSLQECCLKWFVWFLRLFKIRVNSATFLHVGLKAELSIVLY